MRKTLLITDDFPPRLGGVATYYHEICRRLPAEKITVLTAPDDHTGGAAAPTFSYPVYRRRLLSENPFVWPKWMAALREVKRLQRQGNFQRWWVGQLLPYGTVAWWLHRYRGIPYVVTLHGMDIAQLRGRRRRLAGAILRSAAHVVCNSEGTLRYLAPYRLMPSRMSVVTPGVNAARRPRELLLRALTERHQLTGCRVLLTVGRLVARKGHRQVLAALPTVLRRVPNLRYVVIGTGPTRAALGNEVARRNLHGKVIFVGAVGAEELPAWYELADAFVMVPEAAPGGDVEGFGIVYLEAASHAKPSVASDLPGIREAVADGSSGVLVPAGDVEQLGQAVVRLLLDEAFAHRLGLQGQDRALRQFNWESRVERYEELFS